MPTPADPVAPALREVNRSRQRAGPDATMFTRLGWFVVRRRRAVLIGTALFIVVAAALGTGTFGRLKSAGFQDPGAQSTKAENILKQVYGGGDTNVVALVTANAGTVDSPDLGKAEGISAPITIVLLIIVFGGLVAAGLPLLVALIAVFGTLLAIDYSLFIVNPFREELAAGVSPDKAVVRTVETAGRTVAFSALTVAASLSALLVFPLYFLRSFAYAGSSVVVIAALGAVISLPALLAVTGPAVNSLRVWRHTPKPVGEGFWHRLAMAVMRRPIIIGGAAIALLVVLGLPFLRVNFGLSGAEALPSAARSRAVSESLLHDFNGDSGNSFAIVIDGIGNPTARAGDVGNLAAQVSALPAVSRVDAVTGTYQAGRLATPPGPRSGSFVRPTGTWLTVVPSVDQVSNAGQHLIGQIRALHAPFAFAVEGQGATLTDTKAAIISRVGFAFGIIAIVTFILLFLVFGSLLVPIKAIALNLLSLTATFGAMVWIFQDGHLSGPLGFTATGSLNVTMPILMFCIAFGLSMDYEVFLLSRIKEEHDATGDNTHSVAVGLERTGRIVTAAAALLAVTFLAFGTSGISFIEMFGLGLALAVVMDATLIRGVLVPAFMRLAGAANWWAPGRMKRIHDRIGISEGGPRSPAVAVAAVPASRR